MKVQLFENLAELELLKDNWERLCTLDTAANFFLSWTWIYGCLRFQHETGLPWIVLAAKQADDDLDYVAFLPLTLFTKDDAELGVYTQLSLSGVADSHYSGFVCVPEQAVDAAIAFSQYLQREEVWSVFELQHLQSSSLKLQVLSDSFSKDAFKIVDLHNRVYRNELDAVDNSICPYINLPESWEDYLQSLGPSTRKNLRKKLKQFSQRAEFGDDYKITYSDSHSIDADLHALLNLWQRNWLSRKGQQQCAQIAQSWAFLLRHCFEEGCLFLPILWYQGRAVGAIAHFIDRPNRSLLSYASARDDSFAEVPPGLILHAEAIRYAIDHGFKAYDFLMGNEDYKYSFNVQERHVTTLHIHRQGWVHQPLIALNPRSIPEAALIAERYRREGQLDGAKKRYRQILAVEPDRPAAIYALAVIQQRQGDFGAAEELLKQLLTQQPTDAKIWFSLGTLYQQQGRLTAAVHTYQEALEAIATADVATLAIHLNLGYALQQQGDLEGAIAHYETARMLNPDSAEAAVLWANAHHAQGTLSAEDTLHYGLVNLELGHRRRGAGDRQAAIDYYRQAVAMCPDSAAAYYSLGNVLEQVADSSADEIIACYQTALTLAPESDEVKASLTHALFNQGQLSVEEQADCAVLHRALGNQAQQQGNWEAAVHYYRRAIALAPAWSEAHCDLGLTLQQDPQHLDEALACYHKAKSLAPEFLRAEVGRANVLFAQAILPADQLNIYAQLNSELGHQYRQAGQLDLAIAHYRQALNMAPEFAEARENLLLTLQEQSDVPIKVSVAR
jgi:tetratricopeptide (TPR) repeat protein